jgi:hypothetical protein
MLYCQTILPRTGLANRLFPWARCCVYARKHKLPMLAPSWSQVKIGPLLRGERDLRTYHNLFQQPPHYIQGIRRMYLAKTGRKLPEPEDLNIARAGSSAHQVVVFSGLGEYFKPLNGWHEFLLQELRQVVRPLWQRRAAQYAAAPIALHVRRGDYAKPTSAEDVKTKGLMQVPLSWFIDSLQLIRQRLGAPVKAVVASDGTAEELGPLLQLENVEQIVTGSAIGDLLALSQARLLLGSGSSFSAWAAFLGQMPALTHPGQSLLWFRLQPPPGVYVGDFDPTQPEPEALDKLPAALKP